MATRAGSTHLLLPVYLSTLATWAAYAQLVVVLPFRFQQLGLSVVEYGIALAVYALGTLLTEGLWGFLAFRIGAPRPLGLLAALTVVPMVALGFARSFVEVTLLLGLYGMIVVYTTPLVRWLGMTAAGPGTASRGVGRLGLFFGVGLSAGTALGPVLYALGGFALNVYVGVAIFLLGTVPLLVVPWGRVLPSERPTAGTGSVRAVLERRFVLATSLVVVYFMVYSLATNFLQYYSVDLFHGTAEGAGFVIGATRGVAVVTGLVLGSVVDRWEPAKAAPVGFLLLAAGVLGTWVSSSYLDMTAATLVLAAGAGWLGVTLLPMALSRVPTAHQGTAVGVFGSAEDLGLILGPVLLGGVYAALGPRELFPVAAALAAGGMVTALGSRAWRPTERP